MRAKAALNTNREFLIQRYGAGIQLIRPERAPRKYPLKTTVNDLLQLPLNFYFMDGNSILQRVNDQTAASCGYLSQYDAVGRSIREVSKKGTARRILHNDRKIIKAKKLSVLDESYTRLNGLDITAISIKFPWFNEQNQVIGILGCSILTNMADFPSVTESLALLIQTGLLAPSLARADSFLPGLQYSEIYLDKRDKEILFWLTRGKTAKEIGKTLHLSHRTIEHRLEKIKIKLNASSKSELIDKIIDYFK